MEKIISLDFLALNETFHFVAHSDILSKSLFNCAEVSAGSNPEAKRVVSSAKIKISLSNPSTISLMYIKNSKGQSLDPCGTPTNRSSIPD